MYIEVFKNHNTHLDFIGVCCIFSRMQNYNGATILCPRGVMLKLECTLTHNNPKDKIFHAIYTLYIVWSRCGGGGGKFT